MILLIGVAQSGRHFGLFSFFFFSFTSQVWVLFADLVSNNRAVHQLTHALASIFARFWVMRTKMRDWPWRTLMASSPQIRKRRREKKETLAMMIKIRKKTSWPRGKVKRRTMRMRKRRMKMKSQKRLRKGRLFQTCCWLISGIWRKGPIQPGGGLVRS